MNHIKPGPDSLVTYHREGYVGFPDPEPARQTQNALHTLLWNALDEALELAERDLEARVVVLRGAGPCFCAGLDLSAENELLALAGAPAGAGQKAALFKEVKRLQAIHTRLDRLTRPTIAQIHRHCLGGGLELALCCDLLLCSADTVFALPEARLAVVTDVGGLQRLTRAVGRAHAREIAFRGHRFDAEKARAINLVNEVFADQAALEAGTREMAGEIAGNPPLAVQGIKEVFVFDEEATLDESLEYNAARSAMVVPSEDMGEAIASYMEKRPGHFKGA